jgi:hypothetical protein
MPIMLKPFILFFLISCPFITAAQEKAIFFETYNFRGLSPNGQDTLFHHYLTNKTLFKLETDLFEKIPYPEIKTVFKNYFRYKLDSSDLKIVLDHWENKQIEFTLSTKIRALNYKSALQCQMRLVDSLFQLYHPLLKDYFPLVKSNLSLEEIEHILQLQEKNIAKLSYKKEEFLNYEKKFTLPIDSSMWQYMKFGFDLMEKIPTSKYFTLLGANNSSLSFLNDRNLQAYYDLYEKFETDLIQGLDRAGCRAQVAIPFYVKENNAAVEKIHTIRSSIFFFVNTDTSLHRKIITNDTSMTNQIIDSIHIKIFNSNARIDSFIRLDKIKEMGIRPLKLANSVGLITTKTGNTASMLVTFNLVTDEQEKRNILNNIRHPNSSKKIEFMTLEQQKIYYSISIKEDRHTLKLDTTFEGFTMIKDELIQILMHGIGATQKQFETYLQVLKFGQ